jgi:hypothetical protein
MGKHHTEDYKLSAVKYALRTDNQVETCEVFDCKRSSLQERLLCPSCLHIEHFILDVSSVLLVLTNSFLLGSIFLVVKCRFEMFVGLNPGVERGAQPHKFDT